jgi:hypothetical protein
MPLSKKVLMARKTRAQRDAEYYSQSARYWSSFREKLRAATTAVDAVLLSQQAPPPDAPGRQFHSNLGFFMSGFVMPAGANAEERQLYRELMRRMDAAGSLKPGVLAAFERDNPPED